MCLGTPLSQEEADALKVVLLDNGIKPYEFPLKVEDSHLTLRYAQQLLIEKRHNKLATDLRAKVKEGNY